MFVAPLAKSFAGVLLSVKYRLLWLCSPQTWPWRAHACFYNPFFLLMQRLTVNIGLICRLLIYVDVSKVAADLLPPVRLRAQSADIWLLVWEEMIRVGGVDKIKIKRVRNDWARGGRERKKMECEDWEGGKKGKRLGDREEAIVK